VYSSVAEGCRAVIRLEADTKPMAEHAPAYEAAYRRYCAGGRLALELLETR